LIHRRHVLGLLTIASAWPSRSFADLAPRRSEIREALAKRFIDEGTAGTFVGYKVDEDLVQRFLDLTHIMLLFLVCSTKYER